MWGAPVSHVLRLDSIYSIRFILLFAFFSQSIQLYITFNGSCALSGAKVSLRFQCIGSWSPGMNVRTRHSPEYRSRRWHLVQNHRFSFLLISLLDSVLDPWPKVEDTTADKNADPQRQLGAIYDHPQNIDAWLKYWIQIISKVSSVGHDILTDRDERE